MKIIAIETSTNICSIAFIESDKCKNIIEESIPRRHAEILPIFFNDLIEKSGLELRTLDAIAVSIGPGSFTGLRIGLSFAKGIAYSHQKPIIPVPTMDTLLFGANTNLEQAHVILPSHGNKFFVQNFSIINNSQVKSKIDLVSLENINELPDFTSDKIFIGYDSDHLFKEYPGNYINVNPSSKFVGLLARKNFNDWVIDKPYRLVPKYISPFKIGGK